MFSNKFMGDRDPEEKSILTSDEFEDDVCCVCSKTMHLDDKEVFCIGCSNISHLECLGTGNTGSVVELNDGQVKTFKCQKCNTENNLQLKQEKGQANVSVPMFNKRYEKKREEKGPTRDRKCTDVAAFLFLFFVITVFITVITSFGGFERLTNGSDSCGSICGRVNNYPSESLRHNHGCMGADHSDKKLVLFVNYIESLSDISTSPRECVTTCPMNMIQILNFCMHFGSPTPPASIEVKQEIEFSSINDDSSEKFITQESKFVVEELDTDLPMIKVVKSDSGFGDFLKDLFRLKAMEWFTAERLTKLWLLAVAMSYIVVVIFCWLPTYALWIVPFTMAATYLSGTAYVVGFFWNEGVTCITALTTFIALIVLAVLLLSIIIARKLKTQDVKRIKADHKYMVGFYKEAGRLLAAIPCLLLFSLVTMFYVFGIVSFWFRGALLIEGGNFIYSSVDHFLGGILQIAARYLWIGLAIWAIEFILNCQRMVFAGTAAHWYHAKDKTKVSYTIVSRSTAYLIRYHLGTVLYGSLIFHPIAFLKYLFKAIFCKALWTERDLNKLKFLSHELISRLLPDLLVFWYNITSSHAFNMTAMHGKGYCKSEAQSLNLKANHYPESLYVMKSSLSFPTLSIYVVVSTTLLSIYLFGWTEQYGTVDFKNYNFLLVFVAIVLMSFLTGHFFLSAFQLIVDELHLCYIEDVDAGKELKTEFSLSLNKENCIEKVLVEDNKREILSPTSTGTASTLSVTDEPSTLLTESNRGKTNAKEIKV